MKLFQSVKNLFNGSSKFPEIKNGDWFGAGILFIDQNTILAGYKIIDDEWLVSGFGGKRIENEKYYQTAIREVLEELFEIPITHDIVEFVAARLKVSKVVNNNGYVLIICKLKQIHNFILAMVRYSLDTPLYQELPVSLTELIGNRNNRHFSEFNYLTFISTKMIKSKNGPITFDPNLVSDIKYI